MIPRSGSQTALKVVKLADARVVLIGSRTVSDVYGGSNSVSVFTTATTVVQVGNMR
jgi:predicted HAD superfamily phosphohydrolase YqeG